MIARLSKPVDGGDLFSHVTASMDRATIVRTVRQTRRNLISWLDALKQVSNLVTCNWGDAIFVPVDAYLHLTLSNVSSATDGLDGLKDVTDALGHLARERVVGD